MLVSALTSGELLFVVGVSLYFTKRSFSSSSSLKNYLLMDF